MRDFSGTFARLGEGYPLNVRRRAEGSYVKGRYELPRQTVDLVPVVLLDATEYSVTVDGATFSYVTGVGPTADEIVDGLRELVNADPLPVSASATGSRLRLYADSAEPFVYEVDGDLWAAADVSPAGLGAAVLPTGSWLVQPISGADLKNLPEGRRKDATRKLWSLFELQLEPPDQVDYQGETFTVTALTDWSRHAGYYEYALVKAETT